MTGRSSGDAKRWSAGGRSPRFLLVAACLILVFLMGGGQRADVQSLFIIRPAAALICGFGLWQLTREDRWPAAGLFWLLAASVLLCLVQLVPLPPALWRALPGREFVVDIDRAAGLGDVWRPISILPWATRNALFSLLVPLAMLVLVVRLERRDREALLPVLILIGISSGVIGLLQTLGSANSPLYLYSTTNRGWATGMFANRNHAAVYLTCLFPMLAAYASMHGNNAERARGRLWTSIVAGLVLVPMIVASGSRAALIVALPALVSVPFIYRRPRPAAGLEPVRRGPTLFAKGAAYAGAGVIGLALVLLIVMLARTNVLERMFLLGHGDDVRFEVWGGILADVWRFFPFGSGMGTFAEVYQIAEPDTVLRPTYLNHAHNDLLELALVAGLPGLVLIAAAVIGWTRSSYAVWSDQSERSEAAYGRMASVLLFMLALASLADYPLRTPSIACFAVVAAAWLVLGVDARRKDGGGRRLRV